MVRPRRAVAATVFLSAFLSVTIGPFNTSFFQGSSHDMPAVWAQGLPPTLATVDRSRSGSHTGVLTRARGRTVQIDKNIYPLATAILIEDRKGMPISLEELRGFSWNTGLEVMITYWSSLNEVTQIIVTLPE